MNEQLLNEGRLLISGFLKKRRLELGLSQYQLAERTGLARKTIIAMEQGKFWLGMKQYLIICHHLRCYPFLGTMEGNDEFSTLMRERWKRQGDSN